MRQCLDQNAQRAAAVRECSRTGKGLAVWPQDVGQPVRVRDLAEFPGWPRFSKAADAFGDYRPTEDDVGRTLFRHPANHDFVVTVLA